MRRAIVTTTAAAAFYLLTASSASAQEILVHGFKNTFISDGYQFANLQAGTDFGSVPVSGTSGHTLHIENLSDVALTLDQPAVTLSGAGAAHFEVTAVPPAAQVPGHQGATFVISFKPLSGGLKTATVHVGSNDANEGDYDFKVQGRGQFPLAGPDLHIGFAKETVFKYSPSKQTTLVRGKLAAVNTGAVQGAVAALAQVFFSEDAFLDTGDSLKQEIILNELPIVDPDKPKLKVRKKRFKFDTNGAVSGTVFIRVVPLPTHELEHDFVDNQAFESFALAF